MQAGQRDTVETQVQKGISEGAVALTGGGRPSAERCSGFVDGYFFEPTVLSNGAPHTSHVLTHEKTHIKSLT